MNVKEVQERRKKLEADIKILLDEFQKETNVRVGKLLVSQWDQTGAGVTSVNAQCYL